MLCNECYNDMIIIWDGDTPIMRTCIQCGEAIEIDIVGKIIEPSSDYWDGIEVEGHEDE